MMRRMLRAFLALGMFSATQAMAETSYYLPDETRGKFIKPVFALVIATICAFWGFCRLVINFPSQSIARDLALTIISGACVSGSVFWVCIVLTERTPGLATVYSPAWILCSDGGGGGAPGGAGTYFTTTTCVTGGAAIVVLPRHHGDPH